MKKASTDTASLAVFAISLALAITANAKLVAWFPLDEAEDDVELEVAETISNRGDSFTIGYDPKFPESSFVTRGHPSARANLGTSYLINKGGGLELGDNVAVQPTDKFTISFWFQPLTLDAFDRFMETQVTNTNAQDGIRIDMGSGNRVRVLIRDGGEANSQFNHPITLKNDGTWYFFAFRYDSEGIDNAPFQLTVVEASDAPVDEFAITEATGGPAALNTGPISSPHAVCTLIGVENTGGTGGNNLHAAFDELAFYDNSDGNGVLTDEQLANVYNFGPSGVQLISDFSSDIASVSPESPATLSWEVIGTIDSLELDDGEGNVTDLVPLTDAGKGSLEVTPGETTNYKLRATGDEAVNVLTLKILAGTAPEIGSFTASVEVVKSGEFLDLSWIVTGADTLTMDSGAADVTGMTSISAAPTETTTYTLSATNGFGTTSADVLVTVISGPVPAHLYVASHPDNNDNTWVDGVANKNLGVNGAILKTSLLEPSPNTNITSTYVSDGGLAGATAGSFQFPEFTAEIWLRAGKDLGADHEVVFESGGGQNGIAAMITQSGFRFIGSIGDERTLDLELPMGGLVLDDFVQLVFSNDANTDAFEVSIRDTFGNTKTASETADVLIGGNGAVVFAYGSSGLGGDNNLGGRTEAADVNPEGLTGFAGEIAILNIYDSILSSGDIQLAFDAVATAVGTPPPAFAIREIVRDANAGTLTLTWDSVSRSTYGAQFSTDLEEWFDFAGPFTATGEQTTEIINVPKPPEFFVRVGVQQ
ncbi:MAG: LamG-like jellyroll fold domain-containing protein [Verrucomicrobiales bacterium]